MKYFSLRMYLYYAVVVFSLSVLKEHQISKSFTYTIANSDDTNCIIIWFRFMIIHYSLFVSRFISLLYTTTDYY